jgi:hypothetical protein
MSQKLILGFIKVTPVGSDQKKWINVQDIKEIFPYKTSFNTEPIGTNIANSRGITSVKESESEVIELINHATSFTLWSSK